MTAEEGLAFLNAHQPLPDDEELSEEQSRTFDAVREYFQGNPDPRVIRPLLQSFGKGDGFGTYSSAEDVLSQFSAEEVLPHLREAMRSPHPGVRYWSTSFVSSFPDESLIPLAIENLRDDDVDVRVQAAYALGLIGSDEAIPALEASLETEEREVVRDAIEEVLNDLRGSAE